MNDRIIDRILFILIIVFLGLLVQLLASYKAYKDFVDVLIQLISFVSSVLAIYEFIKKKMVSNLENNKINLTIGNQTISLLHVLAIERGHVFLSVGKNMTIVRARRRFVNCRG